MDTWGLESPSKRPALLSPHKEWLFGSPPSISSSAAANAGVAPTAHPEPSRPIPPARPPTAASILHPPPTHLASPAAMRGGRMAAHLAFSSCGNAAPTPLNVIGEASVTYMANAEMAGDGGEMADGEASCMLGDIGPPPLASSAWQQPKGGPHTPPTTPCHPTAISAATGTIRQPLHTIRPPLVGERCAGSAGMSAAFAAIPEHGDAAMAAAPLLPAATATACACASASALPAAAPPCAISTAAQAGSSATEEPSAPPPSPVLGPRPTAREVFGATKRKQREYDAPSLSRVESELDALRIELRPSKLVRCAPLS